MTLEDTIQFVDFLLILISELEELSDLINLQQGWSRNLQAAIKLNTMQMALTVLQLRLISLRLSGLGIIFTHDVNKTENSLGSYLLVIIL